jgi:putative SOS response-associated peptidase YedK
MCYDAKALLRTQLKRARKYKDEEAIKEIQGELKFMNYYHVSGFSHPKLFIYTNTEPEKPTSGVWGLLPVWAKDKEIWNNTLNARVETIFEKPAFKDSAKNKRCLIYLDGFYEHQHVKGKTYPYYIFRNDSDHIAVAGLWNDWTDKQTGEILTTFSIVTTKANNLMSVIHNNPKLPEPRMPLILDESLEDAWLNMSSESELKDLAASFPDEKMEAHTVQRLKGAAAVGNVQEASEKFLYPELNPATLF